MAGLLDGFRAAEVAKLASVAEALRRGVEVRNRHYLAQLFVNTFVAAEAVTWLHETRICATRDEAVNLGRRLQRHGFLRRVLDAGDFRDAQIFFRFAEDEPQVAELQAHGAGHGAKAPTRQRGWEFAAHTAHNSMVLDLALARALEDEAAADPNGTGEGGAADAYPARRTLRDRVGAAVDDLQGWDLERRFPVPGTAGGLVYGRKRPRGDFVRQRVELPIQHLSPEEAVRKMLSFRERSRFEPLFEDGVVVEATLGGQATTWPPSASLMPPSEAGGEHIASAGDEVAAVAKDPSAPRDAAEAPSQNAAGKDAPSPTEWEALGLCIPSGMAMTRLDDGELQKVLHILRHSQDEAPERCLLCAGALTSSAHRSAYECPNCASPCCVACRSKQVFDVGARRTVLVCSHCFAESSRIHHPPRLPSDHPPEGEGVPFAWARDARFWRLRDLHPYGKVLPSAKVGHPVRAMHEEQDGGAAGEVAATAPDPSRVPQEIGAGPAMRFARCRQCGVLVERTVESMDAHSSTCQETIAALQRTWNSEAPPHDRLQDTKPRASCDLGGIPRTGGNEASTTRVVYRTLHSPLSLFQKREVCVLQDAFLRADGSAVVYEISVKHGRVRGMAGYVTAEVLLFALCARPASHGCDVVMVTQMDAKASVPSWLSGAAYLNAFIMSLGGQRPVLAEPVSQVGLGERTAARGGKAGSVREVACSIEDFELLAVLGRGGFGTVMQVRHRATRQLYAMKVLRKTGVGGPRHAERTRTERNILVAADSPFVARMHYAFQNSKKLYMVMDFCPGGDFYTLMRKRGCLPGAWARVYAAEVALALQALHDMDVVYRDLKPENVLLCADGHLKLTDFGLSRHFETRPPQPEDAAAPSPTGQVTRSFCGTEQYMAPEMLLQRGHTKAVDWWCLGLFVHEMLSGTHPFQGPSLLATLANMCSREPSVHSELDAEGSSLVRLLLEKDPMSRLCASTLGVGEMHAHGFFAGLDWEQLLAKQWPAPFVPALNGESDTSHFEEQFVNEAATDSTLDEPSPPAEANTRTGFLNFFLWRGGRPAAPEDASCSDDALYEEFVFVRNATEAPRPLATR